MRFTWIALPVLFMALAGNGATAAATSADDALPDPDTGTTYVASSSELPVAMIPASSGETRLARGGSQVARHDHAPVREGDPLGIRSASAVCVRMRTVDRAGLAFIPELTLATTGFLSACTTACPPPS